MASDPTSNTVQIAGITVKVKPGSYSVDDLAYWQTQSRAGQPTVSDVIPEVPIFWDSLHAGYGSLYYNLPQDVPNGQNTAAEYLTAQNMDASIVSQLTLGPGVATTGIAGTTSVGQQITQWREFGQTLFAVASQNVLCWVPTASPAGWVNVLSKTTGSIPANANIGLATVFTATYGASVPAAGQYLYVPTGSSGYWVASTASTWSHIVAASAAGFGAASGQSPAHFATVANRLWQAALDTNGVWRLAQSSDGVSWAPANIFQGGNGTATITSLLSYDNRLYVFSTQGLQTIDNAFNVIDLVPEFGKYGDPQFGFGSDMWHSYAWIPIRSGLLQFSGANVLNTQTEDALKSLGPDQMSNSTSNVRGRFAGVAPDVNFLYGAMNSVASNGFLMKYRDYPDLQPGQGWHPIVSFPGQQVGAPHVSALPWYGQSYPILWTSAGSTNVGIYQARLPQDGDNTLTDANSLYALNGTLDLPIIDDNLPLYPKNFIRFTADVSCPTGTSIQLFASIDATVAGSPNFVAVGGVVVGTTGIAEWDFPSNGSQTGQKIQPRIQFTSTPAMDGGITATQTPVMRSLMMQHYIRPLRRRYWSMDLVAEDKSFPQDGLTAVQKIQALDGARQQVGPIVFQDLLQQYSICTFQRFTYSQSDRLIDKGVQLLAHVELQDGAVTGFYTQSAYTMFSLTS